MSPQSSKVLDKSDQLWTFLSGTHLIKAVLPHRHRLDGDEIINAPLSCYVVKWRNTIVAVTGLIQLVNLIISYNGKYL